MQNGDQLIAGISELTNENGEGVGFELTQPYVLNLIPAGPVGENGEPTSFSVNYTRWIPCSSEASFKVPYTSVVAIGEPDQNILETFKQRFGDLDNDTTDGGDAGDTGTSDSSDSAEESGVSDSAD